MNAHAVSPSPMNPAWRTLRAMLLALVMMGVHLLAVAVWIVFMTVVVEFYKQYFEANNWELPGITLATIELSQAVVSYWYLLVLATIVLDGGLLLGLQFLPPRWSWLRWVWFVGLLVAILAHLGFSCLALTIPVTNAQAAGGPK